MNNLIEKIDFKKVVTIYLILLILTVFCIIIFLGNIYKERIKILYYYHQLTENYEKTDNSDKLRPIIQDLSQSSKDIIDIVIVKNDKIIDTTNKVYKNELTSINSMNNYYMDGNHNIYKLDTKKEFILELFGIKKENKSDYYSEFQINLDNMYTIHYLKNHTNSEKIIIVSKLSMIKNSNLYLKISLAVLTLFFMFYWIIISLMIYQNASKLKINAYFWGIVTLITNLLGVIIYLIYIKKITKCEKCHANISIYDRYCKSCGEKI